MIDGLNALSVWPSNFMTSAGFATVLGENTSNVQRAMSPTPYPRRLFPLLPRDYIRRRRAVRRITDVSLIAILSVVAAYFITRPTGGAGFSVRKLVAKGYLQSDALEKSSHGAIRLSRR